MKKVIMFLSLAVVFCVLLVASVSADTPVLQQKATNPGPLPDPQLLQQGIFFSKIAPTVPVMQRLDLTKPPSPPAALTHQYRNNAINEIRRAVGLKALPTQVSAPVVPAKAILTPDKPVSGRSHYRVFYACNYPLRDNWSEAMSWVPGIIIGGSPPSPFLTFIFDTLPGKTYMVDFSLSQPGTTLVFHGACFGEMAITQEGHLLLAFTANSTTSTINLINKDNNYWFYKAELIQVN